MHAAVRCSTDDEKVMGGESLLRKFGCKNEPRSQEHMWHTDIAKKHLCIREEEPSKDINRRNHWGRCLMPATATVCGFHSPGASTV